MVKNQAWSSNLVEWVYWMAIDILLSLQWNIEYRYLYLDRKTKNVVVRKQPVTSNPSKRYQRLDAYVMFDDDKIFISPDAEDKALCLFHECLEILFSDWKDDYFVPKRWGLKNGADPILNLEDATWEKLTNKQRAVIKAFLPKEP